MNPILIALGKTIKKVSKCLNRSGSTWPGHLVLTINSNFIQSILRKNPELKVILIAGTNGKTTTTKALFHILKKHTIPSIHNDSGANLLNGFASLLINESSFQGNINAKALLFEVDENSLPLILKEIKNPSAVVLLNLFRDQLDRYGEVNITSEKWHEALKKLPASTSVIANADDPQIAFITKNIKAQTVYYSVNDDLKRDIETSHAADSIVCPQCRHSLKFSTVAYSHIGNYQCPSCKFANPQSFVIDVITSLKGVFNTYNLTAAILASHIAFNINAKEAASSIEDLKPAFGRQEDIVIDNKKILLLLSKNPTGFNESLKVVLDNNYTSLLLLLNDRIPDGKDISWIWDVDFEMLRDKGITIYVGGDRAYDLANRLSYESIDVIVTDDLRNLLHTAISRTPTEKTLAILPTYSAMLETREILTGRKIL